jgi:hypothetical protein
LHNIGKHNQLELHKTLIANLEPCKWNPIVKGSKHEIFISLQHWQDLASSQTLKHHNFTRTQLKTDELCTGKCHCQALMQANMKKQLNEKDKITPQPRVQDRNQWLTFHHHWTTRM